MGVNCSIPNCFFPLDEYLKKIKITSDKRHDILSAYMYMSHRENDFYYKHSVTRNYIVINAKTKKLKSGSINTL